MPLTSHKVDACRLCLTGSDISDRHEADDIARLASVCSVSGRREDAELLYKEAANCPAHLKQVDVLFYPKNTGENRSVSPACTVDMLVPPLLSMCNHTDEAGVCLTAVERDLNTHSWIDENYEHELLKEIRKCGMYGPYSSAIYQRCPALILFGSSRSAVNRDLAKKLSDLTGLPVAIRPENQAPSSDYTNTDHPTTSRYDSSLEMSHLTPDPSSNPAISQNSIPISFVWQDDMCTDTTNKRISSSVARDCNEEFGEPQETTLNITMDMGHSGQPDIRMVRFVRRMKFRRIRPSPKRDLESRDRDCTAQIHLVVTPHDEGAKIVDSGAKTKFGFLTASYRSMEHETELPGPNDRPAGKQKDVSATASVREFGIEGNISSKGPGAKFTAKKSQTHQSGHEFQHSTDLPDWIVDYTPGDGPCASKRIDQRSLNASFERLNPKNPSLNVIFGIGVNLIEEKRPEPIGFIIQEHIPIWVPMKGKTPWIGVNLMVLEYIKDISFPNLSRIYKDLRSDTFTENLTVTNQEYSPSRLSRWIAAALARERRLARSKFRLVKNVTLFLRRKNRSQQDRVEDETDELTLKHLFPTITAWDVRHNEIVPMRWPSVSELKSGGATIIREVSPHSTAESSPTNARAEDFPHENSLEDLVPTIYTEESPPEPSTAGTSSSTSLHTSLLTAGDGRPRSSSSSSSQTLNGSLQAASFSK